MYNKEHNEYMPFFDPTKRLQIPPLMVISCCHLLRSSRLKWSSNTKQCCLVFSDSSAWTMDSTRISKALTSPVATTPHMIAAVGNSIISSRYTVKKGERRKGKVQSYRSCKIQLFYKHEMDGMCVVYCIYPDYIIQSIQYTSIARRTRVWNPHRNFFPCSC